MILTRLILPLVVLGVVACFWAGSLAAQSGGSGAATLIADSVFITPEGELVAEGNVTALHDGTRLQAERVRYDPDTETLRIDGPIEIEDGLGTRILASSAELDRSLENGLLTSARLVLDDQLQLAAQQMNRTNGRYTQLYKTAVTSCHVCEDGRPPLWQIRARRVIHDQEERQLYFEGAQLRVLNVPVFYFPALRLPDPTLDRANGFLIPSIRTTSQLGTGVRVPYFFRLGDHADLTLSPYLSRETRTLGFRYRQAFRRGEIEFEGAYTDDTLTDENIRGYLFGSGFFELRNDFKLSFDIATTSDDAYLIDYGITDADRLDSRLELTRTKRNSFIGASIITYDSLRDSEDEATLPTPVYDAFVEHRFFPAGLGGELRLSADVHQHSRSSTADVIGRDIGRATADMRYLRSYIMPAGVRTDLEARLTADFYEVTGDSNFDHRPQRVIPAFGATFRYPMTRQFGGVRQFLEPVAQLGWSNVTGDDVPNDESRFVEFDEGNLLSLSRFPAEDRIEDGLRLAYGVNWARYGDDGWDATATLGQVLRSDTDPDFSVTSGLSGTASDYLIAGQVKLDRGLSLTARGLFDDALVFSKTEIRGDWVSEKTKVTGTFLWLGEDPALDRPDAVSEFWVDGAYDVSPNWTASGNLRYDLTDTRATTAGVGLVYRNECVEVDLSLSRRFTSSTSVEPSTDFGFTIALRGFALAAGTEKHNRACT